MSELEIGKELFSGYSGCRLYGREADIEKPAVIIGDEVDENLDLDLGGGPEKESGEHGPQMAFFFFFRQNISDVEGDKIKRNRIGSGKPIAADPCGFRPG